LLGAGIAQLVEHDLAKVGVASSSLVSRSKINNLAGKISPPLPVARQRFSSGQAARRYATMETRVAAAATSVQITPSK
jgi:hypothetical protein